MNVLLEFGADVYFPVDVHKMDLLCIYGSISVYDKMCVHFRC